MYQHLLAAYTNLPKKYPEFPDYSYDAHFNTVPKSYVSRQDVLQYLEDCDIRGYIKFTTVVSSP